MGNHCFRRYCRERLCIRFIGSSVTFGSTVLNNAGFYTYDIFIAKYDGNGNVVWAKSAGGSNDDKGYCASADKEGNVYLTGSSASSTITFGSITLTNSGGGDIFLTKYNSTGDVLWAKRAGGIGIDEAFTVLACEGGIEYVTGSFGSSSITFGPTTLGNSGDYDIYVAKYNGDGNALWAKKAGGSETDWAYGSSADVNRNVYLTGYFDSPSISFGATVLTNAGLSNIFIAKLGAGATGIEENIYNDVLNIFPNPFSSKSILQTNNSLHNATLMVENVLGEVVAKIENIKGNTVDLSRNNLSSGVYFVHLTEYNKIIGSKKIVITD